MSISAAIAIYFILWWLCLFAVLPFRIRSQQESGAVVAGSDPGAPQRSGMLWRVVATTVLATIVFALFYYLYVWGGLRFDDIPFLPHHLLR